MNPQQQERYSRHILLPEVGDAGQKQLMRSSVLVMGLGGLGSPVCYYLAGAGVGNLVLADFDKVDITNLQRQIIHRHDTVGQLKVESAKAAIRAFNQDVLVETISDNLTDDLLLEQIAKADVVVDCTDNFASRFAINQACVQMQTPLVSGAAIRWQGQVTVFDARKSESPCYQCLYQEVFLAQDTCASAGVTPPLVGIVGSMQAMEVVKLILGLPDNLVGRLLRVDARTMQFKTVKLEKDEACTVCAHG